MVPFFLWFKLSLRNIKWIFRGSFLRGERDGFVWRVRGQYSKIVRFPGFRVVPAVKFMGIYY